MNIVKTLNQFNINNVYFLDPIRNNIMNNGSFIRIIYSTPTFVLNGLFLLVKIDSIVLEKYFNKLKCSFNINECSTLIDELKLIEENILKKIQTNKIKRYKIHDQLITGNIRIFINNNENSNIMSDNDYLFQQNTITKLHNNTFILKISGLWETDTEIGITYKFIKI